jgi:heat shock protein HslJ
MRRNWIRAVSVGAASLAILAAAASPSFAQTATQSLKTQLIGHWRLVAADVGGQQPFGADPQGSMFFDAGGHYSVVVVGPANAIAYFGEYTIDEAAGAATMHVDGSTRQSFVGRDSRRLVGLSGDRLTLRNGKPDGSPGAVALTWERAN